MSINIYDLLHKNTMKSGESGNNQLNNINVIGLGEAETFEDAGSFDDFVEGGDTQGDMNMDTGMDMGGDGFGDEATDGKIPKDALEFLENLDESESPLVQQVMANYASLYKEQQQTYNKLLLENLDTTEYKEQVADLKKQYGLTLDLLKHYLMTKFKVETTAVRIETFVDFKYSFQNLNDALVKILEGLK